MESATILKKQKPRILSANQTGRERVLPVISKEEFIHNVNKRAYQYYLDRGARQGSALTDWVRAEKELLEKYRVAE